MRYFGKLAVIILFWGSSLCAQSYVSVKPLKGDGIMSLLRRYFLPTDKEAQRLFKELNKDKFDENDALKAGVTYDLPVLVYNYNGQTIRSTLGISDYNLAKKIQTYNERLVRSKLKNELYKSDLQLWVPVYLVPMEAGSVSKGEFTIFGKENSSISLVDNKLMGKIFYLVSGHGGPDPGAIGKRGNSRLYEDEYAYDITLRLARQLLQHDAKVYIIVRDPNDGIRDDAILKGDHDEYYYGNQRISSNKLTRLNQRVKIINDLYYRNRSITKNQYTVILHVDSRSNSKRIDIFYYYKKGCALGKKIAKTLYKTIKKKYDLAQPGRGYSGVVMTRDLHLLRELKPTSVYIELGNIRNFRDQDRFTIENNRQAVANWLCEGLIDVTH